MSKWLELVKIIKSGEKSHNLAYPQQTEGDKRVENVLLSPSVCPPLGKIEKYSPVNAPKASSEKMHTIAPTALTIGDKSLNPWDELQSNLEPITKELKVRGKVLVRARWFTAHGLEVLTTPSLISSQTELEDIIKEARSVAGNDTVHASLLTRDHTARDVVLAGFSKTEWRLWLEVKRKAVQA